MAGQSIGTRQFLWWNTSLSPPGAESRSSKEHFEFVTSQLNAARELLGWDILGLAEVNDQDVAAILAALNDPYLSSVDMGDRGKRAVNDTALIFDRRKFSLLGGRSLYDLHGARTIKAGHLASFSLIDTESILHVVVAHWPGRMLQGEASELRRQLGMSLHRSLRDITESEAPHIVVMGDFNDDPFSPSLSSNFCSTRDRTMAKAKPYLFYNPFWRKIGESEHHESNDEGVCGTHYYSGGTESRWFTFDQIIFSSAFLTSDGISLDEASSQIVKLPMLRDVITSSDSIYDHYPVSGSILLRTAS